MTNTTFFEHLFRENFFLSEVFYKPLLNALIWLYQSIALHDLGLAIILLTIAVRVLLYPLFHQAAKQQRLTQQLQPELLKIKKKHKNDREAQTKATLELFKRYKLNPLSSFFSLLIQIPIFLALYVIFLSDLTKGLEPWLYSFTPKTDGLSHTFFNLVNLREVNLPIAVLAALAQYFQGKLAFKGGTNQMAKVMIYLLPVIILAALFRFPAGVGLYWLTTTIFSIMQQVIVNRAIHNTMSSKI